MNKKFGPPTPSCSVYKQVNGKSYYNNFADGLCFSNFDWDCFFSLTDSKRHYEVKLLVYKMGGTEKFMWLCEMVLLSKVA
jgi:hypothetical protein